RWLESDVGLGEKVYAPFKPLRISENEGAITTWGHSFVLGTAGLIRQVRSGEEAVLAAPITLEGTLQDEQGDRPIVWEASHVDIVEQRPDHATWRGHALAGALRLSVQGRVEFDGCAILTLELHAGEACRIHDLALRVSWRVAHAELATGMGYRGRRTGNRTWRHLPQQYHFGPCIWMGSINAGLGWLTESGEPWDDPTRVDAATVIEDGNAVTLKADFGTHTVAPDRPWRLRFALRPTPVKPPDPRHWQFRYMHVGGDFQPGDDDTPQSFLKEDCRRLDEIRELGVRRLNLHDWWGPAFNYPWQWDGPKNLSRLTTEAHKRGLFVKVYNSGRELSTLAPEFWALVEEASRGEISVVSDPHLAHQRFQDAWHENHHPDDFAQGWPRLSPGYGNEHTVVVGCAHRYGNFYLESLRYMTRFFGTDGAYWDGAENPYPSKNRFAGFGYVDRDGNLRSTRTYLAVRELAKRAWTMLRQENPDATIDSHHGNTMLSSPIAEHMLCLPFIDSIWHGEGFDYDRLAPWAWLVEIAALPFGVPSELLGGEAYIGRAMLFGIWPRAGWNAGTEKQRRLWDFFDRFGIQEARMVGWWERDHPVVVDRPETYVTAFVHPERGVLLAISSWHPPIADWIGQTFDVSLLLDRDRLDLGAAPLQATDILTDEPLDIEAPIPLANPQEGRLIWVRR
ncbi:MAG: glycoside hydrolase domain-containing protein, partial [Anaerolineae bacterium]